MANGMEALYVGSSGLRSAQNAINTSANNLANVNTAGYVRQQVLFADKNYNTFDYISRYSGVPFYYHSEDNRKQHIFTKIIMEILRVETYQFKKKI